MVPVDPEDGVGFRVAVEAAAVAAAAVAVVAAEAAAEAEPDVPREPAAFEEGRTPACRLLRFFLLPEVSPRLAMVVLRMWMRSRERAPEGHQK